MGRFVGEVLAQLLALDVHVRQDLGPASRGSHHAARPSSDTTAGTIVIRTMNASIATPIASAKPIDLMTGSSTRMKPANTDVMMNAAAVTTRAPWPMPLIVASRGVRRARSPRASGTPGTPRSPWPGRTGCR